MTSQEASRHERIKRENNANPNLWKCPVCRNRFKTPYQHVLRVHWINKKEYKAKFGVEVPKTSPDK